jgi:hypothetical protein
MNPLSSALIFLCQLPYLLCLKKKFLVVRGAAPTHVTKGKV